MIHDLIKHGPRHFECRVCEQQWRAKPHNACPGIKVFDKWGEYGHLVTKKQLAERGYRTAEEYLPPAIGCYYSPAAARYMTLYDPIQAIPKSPRGRTTTTRILWPLHCLPLLEMLYFYVMTKSQNHQVLGTGHRQLQLDIANLAASTLAFTEAELEQMAGYTLEFTIPPTLIHRSYSLQGQFWRDESLLITHLLTAYRKHLQNITRI